MIQSICEGETDFYCERMGCKEDVEKKSAERAYVSYNQAPGRLGRQCEASPFTAAPRIDRHKCRFVRTDNMI